MRNRGLVAVRGAGDLATGTVVRLFKAGFFVVALEIPDPTVIRRTVSFAKAVHTGSAVVEGVEAVLVPDFRAALDTAAGGRVPVLVDPAGTSLAALKPAALVDAIIAKRNLGTALSMAPVVVALGPGFLAGKDAHAVIETQRGHDLGRIIFDGTAAADTGIPGVIDGHGADRVIHAPYDGRVRIIRDIGSRVFRGEPMLELIGKNRTMVVAPFDGVVRGMIREGFAARKGMKIADVDPRCDERHCFTISDKARAIAGGVLEGLLALGAAD